MAKQRKSLRYAQNFIKSPELVRKLIRLSSINKQDLVCEIGPGQGIITNELASAADRVIAVEIDPHLVDRLTDRFSARENVRILQGDILHHPLPGGQYKIFANIPFNQTAGIVRKILFGRNPPLEAYLVLQEEAARKFSGEPLESLFSIRTKIHWEPQILYGFKQDDFDPAPSVNAVFLGARRRKRPLIEEHEVDLFNKFVAFGYGSWKSNLKAGFKPIFTYTQWKRLAKDLDFAMKSTPTELSLEQWVGLFECFQKRVPTFKKKKIV